METDQQVSKQRSIKETFVSYAQTVKCYAFALCYPLLFTLSTGNWGIIGDAVETIRKSRPVEKNDI